VKRIAHLFVSSSLRPLDAFEAALSGTERANLDPVKSSHPEIGRHLHLNAVSAVAVMFMTCSLIPCAPCTAFAGPTPLPSQGAPRIELSPALSPSPTAAPPPSADPRRGIVAVERDGKPVGVGTVLGGDGRVLTALSSLSGAEEADLRYADGSVVKARVGHKDLAWDLVLLIPQSGKWLDGLRASELDPASVEIRTFQPGKPRASVVVAKVRGRSDARSQTGETLPNALDVDVRAASPVAGAPLVDASGTVLGVLVRVCKGVDAATCAPMLAGAPIAAVRSFLVRTPVSAVPPSPFLGIVGAAEPQSGTMKGVRVVAVAPGSPAEKGALKPNVDVIVAVDGQPVDTPEKLAELVTKHAVGDLVKLLVFGGERLRDVQVALRATP
jgi:serine protease Do